MSTYASASNQIAALKELYKDPSDVLKDVVYRKNPALALVPKDESPDGMGGKYFPSPIIYGSNQGRSATFTNAQSNQTPAQVDSFFVYRVSNYSIATITNELLEATVNNAGAFIDQGKLQVDGAFRSISNDLAGDLFGGGTGSRGSVSVYSATGGTPNTVTITLSDPQTVTQFEVNMTLTAQTTDGGVPSSDTVQLSGVDRVNGILTGTGSASSLSANWAVGSFLAVQGDVNTSGSSGTGQGASSTSYLKVTGFAGWVPLVQPTSSDSFWNVNRSADSRLYGQRVLAQDRSIQEALIDLSTLICREGGEPDFAFPGYTTWGALEKELGAKVQYVQVEHDDVEIAFKGMTLQTPDGPVTVIADRNQRSKIVHMLQMDTWKLRSLNKAPHILRYGSEGLDGLRVYNSDALEVRVGYYANLVCNAPAWNGIAQTSI